MQRDERIYVRVTKEDKKKLQQEAKAHGLTLSEFMLKLSLMFANLSSNVRNNSMQDDKAFDYICDKIDSRVNELHENTDGV